VATAWARPTGSSTRQRARTHVDVVATPWNLRGSEVCRGRRAARQNWTRRVPATVQHRRARDLEAPVTKFDAVAAEHTARRSEIWLTPARRAVTHAVPYRVAAAWPAVHISAGHGPRYRRPKAVGAVVILESRRGRSSNTTCVSLASAAGRPRVVCRSPLVPTVPPAATRRSSNAETTPCPSYGRSGNTTTTPAVWPPADTPACV